MSEKNSENEPNKKFSHDFVFLKVLSLCLFKKTASYTIEAIKKIEGLHWYEQFCGLSLSVVVLQ